MKKEGILYEKTFIEFNYRAGMPDCAFLHERMHIYFDPDKKLLCHK